MSWSAHSTRSCPHGRSCLICRSLRIASPSSGRRDANPQPRARTSFSHSLYRAFVVARSSATHTERNALPAQRRLQHSWAERLAYLLRRHCGMLRSSVCAQSYSPRSRRGELQISERGIWVEKHLFSPQWRAAGGYFRLIGGWEVHVAKHLERIKQTCPRLCPP